MEHSLEFWKFVSEMWTVLQHKVGFAVVTWGGFSQGGAVTFQNTVTSAAITWLVQCRACYNFPRTSYRLHIFRMEIKPHFTAHQEQALVSPVWSLKTGWWHFWPCHCWPGITGFHLEQGLHFVRVMKSGMVRDGVNTATIQIIKKRLIIVRAKHHTCIQHSPKNGNRTWDFLPRPCSG